MLSLVHYRKSHTHDFDFHMKKVEFLIVDTKTGEIKYRNRRTLSLHPDAHPEECFRKWMLNIISLFRNQDNEKYANCIVQFSCKEDKKAVQGVIFPDYTDFKLKF